MILLILYFIVIPLYFQGASSTEVLERYKGEVVRQAYQGYCCHHTGIPQLPHEKLDTGSSEHLQGCQEGPRAWPLVPLATNPSCFTG